jgi:hypothetical protein
MPETEPTAERTRDSASRGGCRQDPSSAARPLSDHAGMPAGAGRRGRSICGLSEIIDAGPCSSAGGLWR